jgi:uncharacterized protein YbbK (DUF523 family)
VNASPAVDVDFLAQRLRDARSRRVVFVSHCLLNQGVRYLGGASHAGVVPKAIESFVRDGVGLHQMPCPEAAAWGGVMKRLVLRFYGAQHSWPYRFRAVLLPIFLAYTRWVLRRIARRTASTIADYVHSGYDVVGVIGVGDSPSCGVRHTLDLRRSLPIVATLDVDTIDASTFNQHVVRACMIEGEGLFIAALRRELHRRGIAVPFTEYMP